MLTIVRLRTATSDAKPANPPTTKNAIFELMKIMPPTAMIIKIKIE